MQTPDPNRSFHLYVNGKTSGPYTLEILRERYRRGQISSGTLWSQPGALQWESLNSLASLLGSGDLPPVPKVPQSILASNSPVDAISMPSLLQGKPLALIAMGLMILAGLWLMVIKPANERQHIQRVLATDKAIHAQIQQQMGIGDRFWDQSESVGKYVAAMRQIDLSGCPDDFREAFQRHTSAWGEFENVARQYGGWSGFFKGFLTGFTQGAVPNNQSADTAQAQRAIKETWEQVLRVAQNHGVR
jgi:hypothetical protein